MPGPQTPWPVQDSLPWLAQHEYAVVGSSHLSEQLEAQVQQEWFEDGRRKMRTWLYSCLGVCQQAVSRQQGSSGAHADAFCPR